MHDVAFSLDAKGSRLASASADGGAEKSNSGQIPEGALLMLPAGFDTRRISTPALRKIAETLKRHGGYVVDRNEGTPFVISFTPTEYGNTLIGKLVIATDDVQWSYEVRGTHPEYIAPVARASKVDSHISRELEVVIKRGLRRVRCYLMLSLSSCSPDFFLFFSCPFRDMQRHTDLPRTHIHALSLCNSL